MKKRKTDKPIIPKVIADEPQVGTKEQDEVNKLQEVIGLSLETAFNLATTVGGAKVVTQTHPSPKLGNVDSLPRLKKTKK